MAMWLTRLLVGTLADHCTECGAKVPDGSGYRVLSMQVYCSEEHAVAAQQNSPI